ncbi:MAG: Trp family transcriptional regulator [bacterium]|nr:Trp family transcriptional regulator [bacterium]
MKNLNQFSSRSEWEKFLWDEILLKITTIRSSDDIRKFLDQLISDYEKKLILRRATIMLMIRDGLSYREIGKILWTSPLTVKSVKEVMLDKSNYRPHRSRHAKAGVRGIKPQNLDVVGKISGILESLLMELGEYLVAMQEGYSNPSKRWEFIRKRI